MVAQPLNPGRLAERLAAELNENPEARQLLLSALLTDEFLTLPAKVDKLMELPAKVDELMKLPAKVDELMELPAKVDELMKLPAKVDGLMELPGRVERLETDVSDLKAGQAEMRTEQAEMRTEQAEMRTEQAEMRAEQAEMRAEQAEMRARQTRMEGDIVDLKAGQSEIRAEQAEMRAEQALMKDDIADLKAGQSRMQGQIGNLMGAVYERRMINSVAHTVRRALDMRGVKILKGDSADAGELSEKVADAETRGLITPEQGDSLFWADAVISGTRGADRSPLHAVIEISVTIGESDVVRAAERAAILSAVMGEPAAGVVVGESVSEPDRRRAERAEVAVALMRQRRG